MAKFFFEANILQLKVTERRICYKMNLEHKGAYS